MEGSDVGQACHRRRSAPAVRSVPRVEYGGYSLFGCNRALSITWSKNYSNNRPLNMPKAHGSLSATNLANHHHFHCDLYLHYIYHGTDANIPGASNKPSELAKAQFERGLDWEASLYGWLDAQDMLMTVESGLLDASALQELIEIDERSHFFITGLQFWPPNEAFAKRYAEHEQEPVKFGMAKPDLLEVRKQNDRSTTWRVVDAKSSKEVKVRSPSLHPYETLMNDRPRRHPTMYKRSFTIYASSIYSLYRATGPKPR